MSAAGAKPTLSHLDCVSTAAAARARGRGQRLQLFLCPHHESNHDLTTSAGSASCRKWTLRFAAWHSAVARISAELLPPIFPSTWLLSKCSFCGVESFGHTLHEVLSNLKMCGCLGTLVSHALPDGWIQSLHVRLTSKYYWILPLSVACSE